MSIYCTLVMFADDEHPEDCGIWVEAGDCYVDPTGTCDWVDRLRSLGNALVPQIAEWIGRRVMAYEEAA